MAGHTARRARRRHVERGTSYALRTPLLRWRSVSSSVDLSERVSHDMTNEGGPVRDADRDKLGTEAPFVGARQQRMRVR